MARTLDLINLTNQQRYIARLKIRTPLCYNRWSFDWKYNWRRWLVVTVIHGLFCGFNHPHRKGRMIKESDIEV